VLAFGSSCPHVDRRRRSRPARAAGSVDRMWPVIITVVVVVPLLIVAWLQIRRR
jgi:hypothetical protein